MGFSNRIWVHWNPQNFLVEPIGNVFREIHFKVQVNYNIFILTALYASPSYYIRKQLWDKLSISSSFINLPWLLIGDFNDISSPRKNLEVSPPNRMKMRTFNSFLNKAKLIDQGFIGLKFTWTTCRPNGSLVRTRIDRAHANDGWLNIFPKSKVLQLPFLTSDHCPILLKTNHFYTSGRKPFVLNPFG